MTEDEKKEVALFRYSIISELVNVKGLSWGGAGTYYKGKVRPKMVNTIFRKDKHWT